MNTFAPPNEKLLEKQILLRTHRRVHSLRVRQLEEGVTIQGQASSYHVKQLALQAVREVNPTLRVWNRIVVNLE